MLAGGIQIQTETAFSASYQDTTSISISDFSGCSASVPCNSKSTLLLQRYEYEGSAVATMKYTSEYLLTVADEGSCLPPPGGFTWTGTGVVCDTQSNPPADDSDLVKIAGMDALGSTTTCHRWSSALDVDDCIRITPEPPPKPPEQGPFGPGQPGIGDGDGGGGKSLDPPAPLVP